MVSKQNPYLVGFVTRKDLSLALAAAKRQQEIFENTKVLFSAGSDADESPLGPPPLRLRRIVDLAPITVTDETPMETVVDMFRKLGLRQVLVTHNG